MAKKKKSGLIELETEALREILSACLVTTTGPLSLPVLSCALIEIDPSGEKLKFTSTDLDNWITVVVPATMEGVESMKMALPASSLVEISREADSDMIELRPQSSSQVDVKAGRCRLRLQGMDAGSFPPPPPEKAKANFRVKAGDLTEMIEAVSFATTKVAIYPVLTGIYLEASKDKVRLTATDRHRLATVCYNGMKVRGKASWIIPSSALSMVKKLWDDETWVHVGLAASWFLIWDKKKERVLAARLIGGDYPDYQPLLKAVEGGKYLVKKDELASCIRRVAIVGTAVTGAYGRVIHVSLSKGRLQVEGSSDDRGRGKESLRVKSSDAEERDFWMGSQKLLDSLKVIGSDTVTIHVGHTERPILIESTEEDERHVLIPRRAP